MNIPSQNKYQHKIVFGHDTDFSMTNNLNKSLPNLFKDSPFPPHL